MSDVCGVDGTALRRLYPVPKGKGGKNTRLQRPRWWVCERGHHVYRKRRKRG